MEDGIFFVTLRASGFKVILLKGLLVLLFREMLYEEATFPDKELSALVASKVLGPDLHK